jgi:uncharacterized iron-regulated protein
MLYRVFLSFLVAASLCFSSVDAQAHPHILDLEKKQDLDFDQLLEEIKDAQVIFIGELHDQEGHHRMQLEVIRGLTRLGKSVAVGLEMFQQDYQGALDKWVAGEMTEEGFVLAYNQNWSMWPIYRPIFIEARSRQTPMVALNVSRSVTRQVARSGFESLTEGQREGLEGVSCRVDPAYEDFIRRALGGHGHGQPNFIYFCEAQLLWDAVMARNIDNYLERHPETTLVVLAGSGHSWKHGIAHQLDQIADRSYKVILPEVRGRIDRSNAQLRDADYLWLDSGPQGWGQTE